MTAAGTMIGDGIAASSGIEAGIGAITDGGIAGRTGAATGSVAGQNGAGITGSEFAAERPHIALQRITRWPAPIDRDGVNVTVPATEKHAAVRHGDC